MLVLSRKTDEQIIIGENITVTVLRVQGRIVKIGIDAPGNVPVFRRELLGKASPRETGDSHAASQAPDEEPATAEDPPRGRTALLCHAPRDRLAPGKTLRRRAGLAPSSAP